MGLKGRLHKFSMYPTEFLLYYYRNHISLTKCDFFTQIELFRFSKEILPN